MQQIFTASKEQKSAAAEFCQRGHSHILWLFTLFQSFCSPPFSTFLSPSQRIIQESHYASHTLIGFNVRVANKLDMLKTKYCYFIWACECKIHKQKSKFLKVCEVTSSKPYFQKNCCSNWTLLSILFADRNRYTFNIPDAL